ncbi:hypothetical protein P154DRAFT_82330 [Amniculicola lignicola CBS 123094]|uniref:Uncharacterized protein n=1 Tax=Amniculicola lignicola CBS 123094 TaxID=1392246 RepID=A0A6A5VWX6_9PLEO|nr:hypothetical protein P154DRAFT_82330 [Amniculicola lignicola CBS 123094]
MNPFDYLTQPLPTTDRRQRSSRLRNNETAAKTLCEVVVHPTNTPANPTLLNFPQATIISTAHSFHKSTTHDPPLWQLHSTAVRFPEQRVDDIWLLPAQDVYETVFIGANSTIVETVWTLEDRCVVRSVATVGNVKSETISWNHPMDPQFRGEELLQMREKEKEERKDSPNSSMSAEGKGQGNDGPATPTVAEDGGDVRGRQQDEDEDGENRLRDRSPDVHEGVWDVVIPRKPAQQFLPAPMIHFPKDIPPMSTASEGTKQPLTIWERRRLKQTSSADKSAAIPSPEPGTDEMP